MPQQHFDLVALGVLQFSEFDLHQQCHISICQMISTKVAGRTHHRKMLDVSPSEREEYQFASLHAAQGANLQPELHDELAAQRR